MHWRGGRCGDAFLTYMSAVLRGVAALNVARQRIHYGDGFAGQFWWCGAPGVEQQGSEQAEEGACSSWPFSAGRRSNNQVISPLISWLPKEAQGCMFSWEEDGEESALGRGELFWAFPP